MIPIHDNPWDFAGFPTNYVASNQFLFLTRGSHGKKNTPSNPQAAPLAFRSPRGSRGSRGPRAPCASPCRGRPRRDQDFQGLPVAMAGARKCTNKLKGHPLYIL